MRRFVGVVLSALLGSGLLVAGASQAVAAPPVAAGYQAVQPIRILDTRTSSPVGPEGTITLDLSAHLPATATAVVLNVTGTQPTAQTWITVYQNGIKRPFASNLNLVPGENRPNLVTVGVDGDREVNLYNQAGTVHLIADLSGYYAPEATGKYTPLDGKTWAGKTLGPDSSAVIEFREVVPESATAVAVNLTGSDATGITFLTAWPTGTARPNVSNMNLAPGQRSSNLAVVPLGADKQISLYNYVGAATVRLNIVGYYTPEHGALFTAVPPQRVLDTRENIGIGGPLGPDVPERQELGSVLPGHVSGVLMNVTGISLSSHTSVFVGNGDQPVKISDGNSILQLAPQQIAPNLVAVGVGQHNSLNWLNEFGVTHVVADLAGYFWVPPAS